MAIRSYEPLDLAFIGYDGNPDGHIDGPINLLCRHLSAPLIYRKTTGVGNLSGWEVFGIGGGSGLPLPAGGQSGMVLAKNSTDDGDAIWIDGSEIVFTGGGEKLADLRANTVDYFFINGASISLLKDGVDPTKQANFDLSLIETGTTATIIVPLVGGVIVTPSTGISGQYMRGIGEDGLPIFGTPAGGGGGATLSVAKITLGSLQTFAHGANDKILFSSASIDPDSVADISANGIIFARAAIVEVALRLTLCDAFGAAWDVAGTPIVGSVLLNGTAVDSCVAGTSSNTALNPDWLFTFVITVAVDDVLTAKFVQYCGSTKGLKSGSTSLTVKEVRVL